MKLTAEQMRSLPDFFKQIFDPRRAQGRRHSIHVVLAIAAAAVLFGMRGYKAISDWAKALSSRARDRFGCRFSRGKNSVPSESTIRNVLIRVTTEQALRDNRQHWTIENSCHYILDWTFDEDRCGISKGYGPENITRLRRFAIGILKSKGIRNVTQKMRQLSFSPCMDFRTLRE